MGEPFKRRGLRVHGHGDQALHEAGRQKRKQDQTSDRVLPHLVPRKSTASHSVGHGLRQGTDKTFAPCARRTYMLAPPIRSGIAPASLSTPPENPCSKKVAGRTQVQPAASPAGCKHIAIGRAWWSHEYLEPQKGAISKPQVQPAILGLPHKLSSHWRQQCPLAANPCTVRLSCCRSKRVCG